MPAVARLGDTSSHGGAIVTASENVLVNGMGVARVGDTLSCPIHGPQPIVEGLLTMLVNGVPVARVGDAAACGAVIASGSENVTAG